MQTSEIVLVQWFDEHWYKITKNDTVHYLPSVTTKLGIVDKPNLARWRGDIGNREADLRMHEASDRGKRIHWATETALKGGAVIYDPWQTPVYTEQGIIDLKAKYGGSLAILRTQDEMVQMWKVQRQLEVLKPQVIDVEAKVYDIEHRDAGTIDGVYWIEEGDYLISGKTPIHLEAGLYINDLKTGKYLDENVWLQLAPYAWMWELIHGAKIAGALVTWTGATIKSGIPGLKTLVRTRAELFEKDYPDYRHAAALWEREHKDDQPQTFEFPSFIELNIGGIRHETTPAPEN